MSDPTCNDCGIVLLPEEYKFNGICYLCAGEEFEDVFGDLEPLYRFLDSLDND